MSTQRLRQVQELFEKALELQSAEERNSFLEEACGDDEELRSDVESLLEHDERAVTGFMRIPERAAVTGHSLVAGEAPMSGDGPENAAAAVQASQRVPPAVREIEGYRLLRELHRGGQGVVYQALQESTKRKVAIKFLGRGHRGGAGAQKRFQREIELIAQLTHPHIVSIFHSGETDDGTKFYVMDYVRGLPLDRYVRDNQLTMADTLGLFRSVCEAVQYAHHHGIVHRDLKPSNILVEADGSPKVLDFGLAKSLAAPPETAISLNQDVMGTLPYMSPEQARGSTEEVDARSDIYALGIILYELLTGCYPYPVAGQIVEVLRNITETQPTPPIRAWAGGSGVPRCDTRRSRSTGCPIDDEVETIVLTALQKERERRYETVAAFSEDVGHYLNSEPITAKRDSRWYVLKKAIHRRRVAVRIGAVFVICVSAIASYSAIMYQRAVQLEARIAFLLSLMDQETGGQHDPDPGDEGEAYEAAYSGYNWIRRFSNTTPKAPALLAKAIDEYTRCGELDPAYAVVSHEGVGHAFLLRAKYNDAFAGVSVEDDIQSAIDHYSEALELDPHIPRARSNRGHAFFLRRDYVMASEDYADATSAGFEELEDHVFDAWRTYFNYGTSLRILGDSDGAVVQYKLARAGNPGWLYCDIMLALAYSDLGQLTNAEQVLAEAQERATADGTSWEGRVIECLRGKLPPDELINSVEEDGQRCEAPYYAGEALLAAGEQDRAVRLFERCVADCDGKMSNWNERRFAEWRLRQLLEVPEDD